MDWSLRHRLRLSALYKKVKLVVWDFDGVFTDNFVYIMPYSESIVILSSEKTERHWGALELVRCNRADGIGLDMLKKAGVHTCVISGEANPIVGIRCEKLKITCFQGIEDKLTKLKEVAEFYRVEMEEVAYVGNDINDLECLQAVGLSIVVADALLDDDYGFYKTSARGGEGAVREICEQIVRAKGGK